MPSDVIISAPTTNAARGRRSYKLPAAVTPLVSAFYMAAIMALLMCTVIVSASHGVNVGLPAKVMRVYMLAMPTAFICVLAVRPLVARMVRGTVRSG